MIDFSKYDFVDFGSGAGDFMEIAKADLGGKKGLGIENDPVRVRDINTRKRDCVFGDVRHLGWIPEKCVRFVTISHLLEHMQTLHDARLVVRSALRLARDFVYIGGPNFNGEPELARQGFKFYWADWPNAHPLHLTTAQLVWILEMEGAWKYMVWATASVSASIHPDVHPLSSPPHVGHYDPKKHPSKVKVIFERRLFTQFVCIAPLRSLDYVAKLTAGRTNDPVIHSRGESV